MKIKIVKTTDHDYKSFLTRLLQRRGNRQGAVEKRVGEIVRAVERKGDSALLRYAQMFDRVRLTRATMEVRPGEIEKAMTSVQAKDLRILRIAARRIGAFHRRQVQKSWGYRDPLGMLLGQRITPLGRVGVYVPGGKASYPSTVLMNVVPAKVAGVEEVIMTSPIGSDGAIILAAARIAGVDRTFRIGGAQAIAALAFGTETIPKVDKIVGADMLSQAEHDERAAALCVTSSMAVAARIQKAIEHQLQQTKRRAITIKALEKYGAIIVTRGYREAIDLANTIEPEHVEPIVKQPQKWSRAIRNAGAIFIGPYSTPPLGDYFAGPNHVLPTGGSARFFPPLGTYDFLKRTTIIQAQEKALRALAPKITHLARLEGLDDHARAVEARFE